jgi:23S rRNA pseudouridine1911/1915/1917 synthase
VDADGATRDEPGWETPQEAALSFHPERPARHRVRTRLSVLFEDPALLVVEKPAGLLTVPTAEGEKDTLLSRVSLYLQHRYRRRPYVGVLHRLDRDTSGAVAFARTREAGRLLRDCFRRHEIDREYVALVEGEPPERGRFEAPLAGDGVIRRRGPARRGEPGKRAVTRYAVIERLPGAALVSVTLETGRTHQIRIHFASAGHPVVGDRVYRPRGASPFPVEAPRQMLHARRLGLPHPRGSGMVRVSSEPPEDFKKLVARLRASKRSAPKARGAGIPGAGKA